MNVHKFLCGQSLINFTKDDNTYYVTEYFWSLQQGLWDTLWIDRKYLAPLLLLFPLLRLSVRNTRSIGRNCMYFCLSYSCVVSIYNALPLFISIFHFSRGNVSSIFVVHLIIHFLHRKKMEKSHVILQKYMFSDVSLNITYLLEYFNNKKSLKIDRDA